MHYPYALQAGDFVSQHLTHAPDLPVQALIQHNAEGVRADFIDDAAPGHHAENGNAFAHLPDKFVRDVLIYGYDIFFVVLVARPQDFVDDVAVVGEQDEAFRVFVEAPDREHASAVIGERFEDVVGIGAVGCGRDANRFVKSEVNMRRPHLNLVAVYEHAIGPGNQITDLGNPPVYAHFAQLNHAVSLPPGTEAGIADKFIKTDGHGLQTV